MKTIKETQYKPWVPSFSTDVMKTFKRLGFVPPSEQKAYQKKWAEHKARGAA
jgi:hypothetical protein